MKIWLWALVFVAGFWSVASVASPCAGVFPKGKAETKRADSSKEILSRGADRVLDELSGAVALAMEHPGPSSAIFRHPKSRNLLEAELAYRELKKVSRELDEWRADLKREHDEDVEKLVQELEAGVINRKEMLLKALRDFYFDQTPGVILEIHRSSRDKAQHRFRFAERLLTIYQTLAQKQGWKVEVVSSTRASHGELSHITIKITGKNAYQLLSQEWGRHTFMDQMSGFSSKVTRSIRVESSPIVEVAASDTVESRGFQVKTSRSSGAGGQNVNKRDTAVEIYDPVSKLRVRVESERNQLANKRQALEILLSKIEEKRKQEEEDVRVERHKTRRIHDRYVRTYSYVHGNVRDQLTGLGLKATIEAFDARGDWIDFLVAGSNAYVLSQIETMNLQEFMAIGRNQESLRAEFH